MNFKSLAISHFFLLLSFMSSSQERNDAGVIFGTSYYIGDFNPSKQFYKPSPAFGVLSRYNFSSLYSLRISGIMGALRGDHDQADFFLPNLPDNPSFSHQFVEVEGALEIGFIPFETKTSNAHTFTPYALFGVGMAIIDNKFIPNFPIGIGLKYTPFNRWTIGAEWRLHKTFSDTIDGYSNVTNINRLRIHNYDWFGIAGIFVTYRLVNKGVICPAYK